VFATTERKTPRAELRAAIEGGASRLKPKLSNLTERALPIPLEGEAECKRPSIVIAIDQGEEMFRGKWPCCAICWPATRRQ
jgi:hypothetical protein